MGHIFISYKNEENAFTARLNADLQIEGVKTWLDRDRSGGDSGIYVGQDWLRQLGEALQDSGGFIAVLTKEYFESQYCLDEIKFAKTQGHPIFPVKLRRFDNADIPPDLFWLPNLQWIDFTDFLDDKAYKAKLPELTAQIKKVSAGFIGAKPEAEEKYLLELIGQLEGKPGVEQYISLQGEAKIHRPNPHESIDPDYAVIHAMLHGQKQTFDDSPKMEPIASIHEAVDMLKRFVLIGDPGAGKTTTIRRLALETARTRLGWLQSEATTNTEAPPIPLLLHLPSWHDESDALTFVRGGWTLGGDVIQKLKSGHVRLYLDGLNEMGGTGKDKAKLLSNWIESSTAPEYIIVTCRQNDYGDELKLGELPTVLTTPLSDERIHKMAIQYLGEEIANPFLEQIFAGSEDNWDDEDAKQRSLLHLARNPFQLSLLIKVYEYQQELPHNAGKLFKVLVAQLWEREHLRQTVGWVPLEQMEAAFGRLAFDVIDTNQPIDILLDWARERLDGADTIADRLLIAGRNAGFIELKDKSLRFSHQLLLEYFAALGLQQIAMHPPIKINFLKGLQEIFTLPIDLLLQRGFYMIRVYQALLYFGIAPRGTKLGSFALHSIGDHLPELVEKRQVMIMLCGVSELPDQMFEEIIPVNIDLAAECIGSGVNVSPATYNKLINELRNRVFYENNDKFHDYQVGRLAIRSLGKMGDSGAINLLAEILHDENKATFHEDVALALRRLHNPTTIPYLLEALNHSDPEVKWWAGHALSDMGTLAAPQLLQILIQAQDRSESWSATLILARMDQNLIPMIIELMTKENIEMEILRRLGAVLVKLPADEKAIQGLVKIMYDKDKTEEYRDMRRDAIDKLSEIGAVTTLASLFTILNDGSLENRIAWKLKNIGTPEALAAEEEWRKKNEGK